MWLPHETFFGVATFFFLLFYTQCQVYSVAVYGVATVRTYSVFSEIIARIGLSIRHGLDITCWATIRFFKFNFYSQH